MRVCMHSQFETQRMRRYATNRIFLLRDEPISENRVGPPAKCRSGHVHTYSTGFLAHCASDARDAVVLCPAHFWTNL